MIIEKISPKGFLLINKPAGVTSFSCVMQLKKLLPKKEKIGHAGTLDPFANGLLIVGISRDATEHMEKLIALDKRYTVTAQLGVETDTHDATGTVIKQDDCSLITTEKLIKALHSLMPSYVQTPPVFSALKHQGVRLYKYARNKEMHDLDLSAIVTAKSRRIFLYEAYIDSFVDSFFTLHAHVSHGTYIRSLVFDIAKKLSVGAIAHSLCRQSVGPFLLDQACLIQDLTSVNQIQARIIPVKEALRALENFNVNL